MLFSDERLRRMYSGGRADRTAIRFARLWSRVFALGLQRRWVTLEVRGRRTGEPTRFPLGMADLDGQWFLVSMLGERCNWVRNVRAAGGRAVLVHGRRRPVLLEEVPPSQRPRILRRYLQAVPGARPHLPVAPDAQLADFALVAEQYPVFRVVPDREPVDPPADPPASPGA
ncbi:MAG: nitroreductase family deazaflavin-dependent oxidoreductase [Actinomycetota bacterium]|nr:nitroreductase family deazaflavin-dependent oxidoreductase [Actinomycetota bacterium]